MDSMTIVVIKVLRKRAKIEYQYQKLMHKLLWLELEFSEIVNELPEEQQDILWDFVFTSDAIDRRLLELTCDFLEIGDYGLLQPRQPKWKKESKLTESQQ